MTGERIPAIDFLKGFSIFTITLMHLIQRMSALPSKIHTMSMIGGTGVHVFFLCSGIGLYLSYLNKKTSYVKFLRRRFMKIYVPYMLVVFVSFCLPWMYGEDDRITALLSHIFLFKMFVPRYEQSFGEQFWFISTIIQLYLFFIPMCILKENVNYDRKFFGIFICISVAWWIFCYALGLTDERIWNSFFLQYIWEFALGMVLGKMFHNGKVIKISNLALIVAATMGIGIQAVMALTSNILRIFNDIPALIGYTALALLLMKIPAFEKAGTWLSKISYEYFLVHILVIVTIFHFVQPKGLTMQIIVGLVTMTIAIVVAYYYHFFVSEVVLKRKL